MDRAQLWSAYREAFGHIPDGKTQELLNKMGATTSAMREEMTLERLHEWALELEQYRQPPAPKRPSSKHEVAPDASLEALARIVAMDASLYLGPGLRPRLRQGRSPVIRAFREIDLGGRELTREEAVRWIEQQAASDADKGTTNWIEFPIAPFPGRHSVGYLGDPKVRAAVLASVAEFLQEHPLGVKRNFKSLRYEATDGSPRAVTTVCPSPLERLRELSEDLARTYAWSPESATTFVLTGEPPAIPKGTATVNESMWPVSAVIAMNVKPSMTANEVRDWYVKLREVLWDMHDLEKRRPRAVTGARSNELAVFIAGANDGRRWLDAMASWNAEHSECAYSDQVTFRRDCVRAYRRITGAELHWTSSRRRDTHVVDGDEPRALRSDGG